MTEGRGGKEGKERKAPPQFFFVRASPCPCRGGKGGRKGISKCILAVVESEVASATSSFLLSFPPSLRHSAAINQRAGAMKRKKTAAASETAPPEVSPPRPPEEEGTIVTARPGKKQ